MAVSCFLLIGIEGTQVKPEWLCVGRSHQLLKLRQWPLSLHSTLPLQLPLQLPLRIHLNLEVGDEAVSVRCQGVALSGRRAGDIKWATDDEIKDWLLFSNCQVEKPFIDFDIQTDWL